MFSAFDQHPSMSAKDATVLSATKAKTQNHLKNNDLSQKKMLSVEAQRISSILKHCISQIEVVATVPAVLNSDSSVVDEELIVELKKHQLLIERLEREAPEGLKRESGGEDGDARARLERHIKHSVRDLLRILQSRPDHIFGLKAERGTKAGESECKLIRGLKMFHSHMVDKLLTSLDEELQMLLHQPVSSLPVHDQKHMASLEEEVAAAKKQIDAKMCQKNIEIKSLQHSLQANKADAPLLTDKKCQPRINISKKQASVQQEIDQLETRIHNFTLENRQAERVLQEKNEKVEREIEYLLQKFDREMEDNQGDLQRNEVDYEREKDELERLEKPFSVLETECSQIREKRRLAKEQREREKTELELKIKAAIIAQAWWRGFSTRKALMNKGKNKKSKKGKGKKK